MALLVCLVGCDDANRRLLQQIQVKQVQGKERRDSIRDAFRYLPQLIRLDRTAALKEIRYQLNTWSSSVSEQSTWKSSGLLDSVSGALRTIDFSKRLTKLEFGEPECEFLLQCQMMKEVGKWVVERPYHLVIVDNGGGTPTVANVQAQATYCAPGNSATDVTNLDFKFEYTGNVDIDRVEAAWLVIPFDKGTDGDKTFDASVTNPLTPPANFKVRSTIVGGALIKFISGQTFKGTLRLTMGDGIDANVPADLEGIQAQAITVNNPARLWVRGITKAGANTEWAKANNITTPATRASGPCDGNI